jgi:hypothetical protein
MVGESLVSAECRFIQTLEFGERPSLNTFLVGEVLAHLKSEFSPPPRTGEGYGGGGKKAVLLKPSFGCLPVNVLEESGDVIGSLQTVVDHEGVFENVQDKNGVTAD